MNIDEIKNKFCRPADERIVLSYCFKSVDYFYDLSSKINEFDFLSEPHQLLFALMKDLVNRGITSIDLAMVITQAQNNEVLDMLGGVGYLQSIGNIVTSDSNFNVYLDNITEASTKFKLYVALKQHITLVEGNAKDGVSGNDLIGHVETSMLDMTTGFKNNGDPVDLGNGLDKFMEDRLNSKITMTGLSSGFPILDRQIDGLIPGTLTVIAARKKMGKSAYLTNIAIHAAFNEHVPVLYIDTELTFSEWRTRALSKLSGVKERDVKHGGWNPEQYSKMKYAQNLTANGKLFHMYMPGYSVDKVVAMCKKMKIKENIGLIVFDYIKEPDLSTTDGNRKEHQLLGDITTKLKDLAGSLDIPALTAVQLNRQNDIADSDRIARFGDVIALWGARTEEERKMGGLECGNYKLTIKDTRRGGSTGPEGIGYWFFKQHLDIREVKAPDQYFITSGDEVTNHEDADEARYNTEVLDELS